MAKTHRIAELLPKVLETLARPTTNTQANTDRARRWILEDGWGYVGNETPEELRALGMAFDEASRFLASILDGGEPYWLVMVGVSGTGKTMLAKRIVRYLSNWGGALYRRTVANTLSDSDSRRCYSYAQEGPLFTTWRSLLPVDSDGRHRHSVSTKDWFKVVDELKPEVGEPIVVDGEAGIRPKPFEVQAASNLLDDRLRKWTIITTNMTRAAIAKFWDVRIASRLTRDGNTIVDLSGVRDFTLRKEKHTKK